MEIEDSGRSYPRIYPRVQRKADHGFVERAVAASGARVLASTGGNKAPLFLGIETGDGGRLAACLYTFHANHRKIKNRPADEHRLQIKYGDINERTRRQRHSVGFDPLGGDITTVLGAHSEAGIFIALDPMLYNPLPLGISIEFKDAEIQRAVSSGWHVWERDNISGARRTSPRAALGIETIVAFAPNRLIDYLLFERDAQSLQLDPPLRFARAHALRSPKAPHGLHALEKEFGLSSAEVLDLIAERRRLGMAVRGGVAERHLQKALEGDPDVADLEMGDVEGPPDFIVTVKSGDEVTVECKNASPKTFADGTAKVEAQKTRASKGDPSSRLYDDSQFDVVAACMYGLLGRWEFRYKRSRQLTRDRNYADRIAPIQRIDDTWSTSLRKSLERPDP